MKHFYTAIVALLGATLSMVAEPMQITDFKTQARGRYSCNYYSPLPGPDGKPWGNCTEQPMIVEDYFAETEGDVNIGYLFISNGILKGHIDYAAGTIEIKPMLVTYYYEDPDDLNDPGRPLWFCSIDKDASGKYVPNYERPFHGTFELHDGMITKITSDDIWAYTVREEDGTHYGYMEIAENSTWYLGHGEMEYLGSAAGSEKKQVMIHASSDGKQVKIYNFMNSGWDNPLLFDVDAATKSASAAPFRITVDGQAVSVSDADGGQQIGATLRAVSWDIDQRDTYDYPEDLCVMDFDPIKAGDQTFDYVRVYAKENLTQNTTGVENIAVDNGPATYYNIQGIRTERPAKGIIIELRGGKATKRFVR